MRGFKGGVVPPFMEGGEPGALNLEMTGHVVSRLSHEGLMVWATIGLLACNRLGMSPRQMLTAMEETFVAAGRDERQGSRG